MTSTTRQHRKALSAVSRRMLLRASAGIAAMGLTPGWSSPCLVSHADLFVFKAPTSGNVVFGVTYAPNEKQVSWFHDSGPLVRVNAGAESWTIRDTGHTVARSAPGHDEAQTFAGEILLRSDLTNARRHWAAVVEVPAIWWSDGKLDVWAEILVGDGSRVRVGNPFVAEIVEQNPSLSEIYHRASPYDDQKLLTGPVEKHIVSMASARGVVSDPEAYARRIAAAILPDVIRYSPLQPLGLSFSCQNGRHPADPAPAVVQTLLGGAAAPGRAWSPIELSDRFPYFVTAVA